MTPPRAWPRRAVAWLMGALAVLLAATSLAVVDASEGPLSTLFRQHQAVMLFIEPESGAIIDANEAAARFYGQPIERLTTMRIQDFNTLGAEEVAAERARARAEQRNYFIFPHRVADGGIRSVEVYSSPVRLTDGRTVLFSVIHDITGKKVAEGELLAYKSRLEELVDQRTREVIEGHERLRWVLLGALVVQTGAILILAINITRRRQAQRALEREQERLRESQELYQSLVDCVPHNVYRVDREGRVIFANPALLETLGVGFDTLKGKTAYDLYPADLARKYRADDERVIGEGVTLHVVEENVDPNTGLRHFVEVVKTPVRNARGEIEGIQGIFWDITERRRMEEALRERETMVKAMLDRSLGFIGLLDTEGRVVQANQTALDAIDATAEEVVGKFFWEAPWWDNLPEEQARARDAVRRAAAGESSRYETMNWCADGMPIIIDFSVRPITDEGGQVMYLIPEGRDITEAKQAEQRIKLAASVFEHAHDGICITNAAKRIIDVNPTFMAVTGYSREELIGQKPSILQSGRQGPEFYEAMWEAIRRNGYWRGEIWNRRRDGEIHPELVTISAVVDKDGAVNHYVGVFTDITLIKQHELKLERIAHFDALTDIPNRVLLADRMTQAIAQTKRSGQLMAVCYLDLDGFKPINDCHGHQAGDRLLVEMASRLKDGIRGGDTVARLGGDEFILLLVGLERADQYEQALRRLLESVAQPVTVNGQPTVVTASIGVTIYPLDDADPDTLLRHADQAMYQAKQAGRNRWHLFDPEHDRRVRVRREQLSRIEEAMSRDELVLHYQPTVNMREGTIVGAEALVRWQHPERGLLPPADFLPLIEEHELIVALGEWVIDSALRQLAEWQAAGHDFHVSVNVAARHLQQPDFVGRLREILARHPAIDAHRLVLEVLETAALEDMALVSRIMQECNGFGVGFALDDFGTGYSSLTYFKRLPASVLKIDQSFVRDMLKDPEDRAIVEGVIGLTNAFRRTVIAEGVESIEHGVLLLRLGCDLAQGYGIARPMPASDLTEWMRAWKADPAWRLETA